MLLQQKKKMVEKESLQAVACKDPEILQDRAAKPIPKHEFLGLVRIPRE
jgi:hypothetical protein